MTIANWARPIVLLFAICATEPALAKDDNFDVPQEQILSQVKRVGILSFAFEDEWPRNAAAADEFERLAVEWLARANINATASSAYQAIESRLVHEQGGWFDPQSGKLISAKRQTIKQMARAEFVAKNQLDGLLELRVDVISARMFEQKAKWHGVSEDARIPTKRNKLLQAFLDSSETVSGSLPALSVAAILYDASGKKLYGRYGGLQLLSLYQDDPVTQFFDVDPNFLFSDPIRNARAMRLALRPLVMTKSEIRKHDAELRKAGQAARQAKKSGDAALTEDGQGLATPTLAELATPDAPPATPLRISRDDLAARVKTIALAPLRTSVDREIPDASAAIEQSLVAALTRLGFKVLPSDIYAESYMRHRRANGPYFDAITGALLEERRAALDASVASELRAAHKADAIMKAAVIQALAWNSNGTVSWDGVSQSFSQSENVFSRMNASFATYAGSVPAISLSARIHALNDDELFAKRVGIQTLRRIGASGEVDVLPKNILNDLGRIDQVVEILLEDLGTAPTSRE